MEFLGWRKKKRINNGRKGKKRRIKIEEEKGKKKRKERINWR